MSPAHAPRFAHRVVFGGASRGLALPRCSGAGSGVSRLAGEPSAASLDGGVQNGAAEMLQVRGLGLVLAGTVLQEGCDVDRMSVSPRKLCVDVLIPNVMSSGGGTFGGAAV